MVALARGSPVSPVRSVSRGQDAGAEISVFLLNKYSRVQRSRTAWKKLPPFQINWLFPKHDAAGNFVGNEPRQSVSMLLEDIDEMLQQTRSVSLIDGLLHQLYYKARPAV